MASFTTDDRVIGIGLAVVVGVLCIVSAQAISSTDNIIGLAITLGILVLLICFFWPEVGLYILVLSMLLGPELLVGNLAGGGTGSRGVTLRVDDFLILIIAFAWFARGAINKELGLFLSTPLNRPIVAYLLVAVVSTAVGMLFDRVRPVVGFLFVLKYIEYIFVYFAVVNFITTKQQIRRFVWVIFLTGILVAIYASLQIPGVDRVTAPFEGEAGEPNTLGGYLMFLMALFAGLLVTSGGLKSALRFTLGLIILGIPFLFTLSRASYLGLLVVAIVIVALTRYKLIAAFTLTIFLLVIILLAPPAVVDRVNYTFGGQVSSVGQVSVGSIRLDTSTSARLFVMQNILRDFPKQPLLGYGVTGYGFVDGQYPRVLIEMGLLGMAAWLFLIFSLFREGLRSLRSTDDRWERGLSIGFIAGLAGLMIHALASNTFIIVRIMEPFWFIAGIVTVLRMINTGEIEEESTGVLPVEEGRISTGLISPLGGRPM